MLQNQLFQEIPFSSIDENILIGHAHNATHTSGCTVIMSSDGEGFLAGVDCRGGMLSKKINRLNCTDIDSYPLFWSDL